MDTAHRREWEERKILSRDKEKEGAGMKIYILEQEEGLAAMTAYGLETEREDRKSPSSQASLCSWRS